MVDKYEYKLRTDQMKALAAEGDFETAAEIADSINWHRVRNVNLLIRAGDIYMRLKRYDEAWEILHIAYDRSSIGRMTIYRLAELAVLMQRIDEAEEYYDEFVEIAPKDSLKYVLRYKISRAKGADIQTQITILEELKEREWSEEWVYELAYLYHKAGESKKCIETCDELILWIGDGIYVERALELKMFYRPLTKSQEDKYRTFKRRRDGVKEVYPVAVPVAKESGKKFDTADLQSQLEQNMQLIKDATEKETVEDTMDAIKKIVEDIPYLRINHREGQTEVDEEYKKAEEAIEKSIRSAYEESDSLLADSDGLSGWEKASRAAQTALYLAEQKQLETVKAKALHETREIMDRLIEVIPKLDAGITPRQLMQDEYLAADDISDEERAGRYMAGMNDMLQQQIERLQEETDEREPELLRKIRRAKPEFREKSWVRREAYIDRQTPEPAPEEPEIQSESIRQEDAEGTPEYLADADGELAEKIERFDENTAEAGASEPDARALETAGDADHAEPYREVDESVSEAVLKNEDEYFPEENENPTARYFTEAGAEDPYMQGEPIAEEEPGGQYKSDDETADVMEAGAYEEPDQPERYADIGEPAVEAVQAKPAQAAAEINLAGQYESDDITAEAGETERVQSGDPDIAEADPGISGTAAESGEIQPYDESSGESTKEQEEALAEEMRLAEAEFYGISAEQSVPQTSHEDVPSAIPVKQDTREFQTKEIEEALKEQSVKPGQKEKAASVPEKDKAITKLSKEQRAIFSYFVPVAGMEDQICRVLTNTVKHFQNSTSSSTGHILIQGGVRSGKTVFATALIKALRREVKRPKSKVGKIDAASLNKKDLSGLLKKVAGGYLVIEHAGEISRETAVKLSLLLDNDSSGLLVIMEDTRTGLNQALGRDDGLSRKFTEKVVIPVFTSDELVEFGKAYAHDLDYEIDTMGVLALYNRISNIQRLDRATTLTEVKEIIDEAIGKVEKKSIKKAFSILTSRRYTKDDYVILREKDFEE